MTTTAPELARQLADALDAQGVDYAIGGEEFERSYVRRWLTRLVGPDDERLQRWERLLADVDSLQTR